MGNARPTPALRCPGCNKEVDPLRAAHVAIVDERFSYFCSPECRRAYGPASGIDDRKDEKWASARNLRASVEDYKAKRTEQETRSGSAERTQHPASGARPVARAFPPGGDDSDPLSPSLERAWRRSLSRATGRREALAALDAVGIVSGALALPIGLLGSTVDVARLPLAIVSWAVLVFRFVRTGRDPADPHPLVVLAPTTGAVCAAFWANAIRDPHAPALAIFAGLSCTAALVVELLVGRARRRVEEAREAMELELDVRVRAVHGDETMEVPASDVRPGEQVVVQAGELAGVDGTVVAGEARVTPFIGATVERTRQPGDPIFAGARVASSTLRVVATRCGPNRSLLRLLSSRVTRVDVASLTARTTRLTIERGAPIAAIVVGVAALAANAAPVEVFAMACAAAMAFGAKAACSFGVLHLARGHLRALSRGIAYKDARSFERAGAANIAVLSARGTVLMGEPEIVALMPLGAFEVERMLSLAAGAETGSSHPVAAAVLRAAKARGVRPDHVRNIAAHAGRGITAVASSGERLVVGGRPLMLEQKIGVAVTEHDVSELEAQGRSVLMVALGDRLIGIIALQDGLRPGARAAVQRLLDARVEPVLLSGEARDTCETIGRALDIEHVRPEVLPAERGAAVRALAEGGNVVAVIGQAAGDDSALSAADVAVAMGTGGSIASEWSVLLANDDVRDAALALTIPHAARDRARVAIALGATPGLVALLAIGVGIAPAVAAAIAVLVGAASAAAHAREAAPSS